ncbi:MAG: NADAR family protein [Litoreibacter sp.]
MDYAPENTIYFYAHTDDFSEFSNFAPYGVAFDGLWWRTVEDYFQAMKFHGEACHERIRACGKPKDAKALGMTRKTPLRQDWEDVKDAIMLDAVRCKFRTHELPRQLLLSTGNACIAENAPLDAYWGIGSDGLGLNRLGEILMLVREELQIEQS